jgi:hypothetical protein
MYHLSKEIKPGVTAHVELGVVMSGDNPEHICNAHVYVEGFCHIRGIIVYKKVKGGVEELLLKLPGYGPRGSETAYLNLDNAVAQVIFDAVHAVPKENYARYYVGPQKWSIWHSSISK